jgi:hypothetical protein
VSNVLAIAGVTQLLKDLVNDALVNGDVSQALGADFTVTALPPDRVVAENGQDQAPQLNLFLHRVTPNESLRNDDLPTRDRSGQLLARPRLALDLHYMLTAVAAEELQAEILLGYAMQLFHETAILSRERIRQALTLAGAPTSATLPDALGVITASELADQIELIKISPQTISMDDMSKMWTALQASYRTTVAYDVSVVLIEREIPTRPTTPVLTRGGLADPTTGRDPGVTVEPSVARTVPSLTSIEPLDRQPVMRLGGEVAIKGTGFDRGTVEVRFGRIGADDFLTLAPTLAGSNRFTVQLPQGEPLAGGDPAAGTGDDPGSWQIGTWMVEARVTDGDGREMVTNSLPIALAPAAVLSATDLPSGVEVDASVEPRVRAGQSVAVLVGSTMQLVDSPETDTGTVTAVFDDLTPGAELPARLRVDGIDSPVIDRSTEPPSLITIAVPGGGP